ncbi:MAG: hypothetical protein U5L09_10060 [Bacteroidales bacterium]|nr:hypothetical protein [Bacteroidales bacterium]
MKNYRNIISIILLLIFVSFTTSCGNNAKKDKSSQENAKRLMSLILLMDHIEQTGDFINSKRAPSMIEPSVVHENLNEDIHIIDIRNEKDFSNGHIPGD